VRRVSLGTLNAAAHNKPHLISESLSQLLPLLFEETVIRVSNILSVLFFVAATIINWSLFQNIFFWGVGWKIE